MGAWDKFDKEYDVEGLQKDADEAAENGGGEFKDVEDGTYMVEIEKLELKESSTKKPMTSCWFNIIEGSCKGQKIFLNQVIDQGFGLHMSNEFLKSLDTSVEVKFLSFNQYDEMLAAVKAEADKCEFELKYGHNNKGFGTYEITNIYDK